MTFTQENALDLHNMVKAPYNIEDGGRKFAFFAFLHYNCERRMMQICVFSTRLLSTHFITQYMERFSEWSSGPDV
jgi:hypothetical protein